MAERFRRDDDVVPNAGARSATTTTDEPPTRVHDGTDRVDLPPRIGDGERHQRRDGVVERGTMAAVRERQREEFGGIA